MRELLIGIAVLLLVILVASVAWQIDMSSEIEYSRASSVATAEIATVNFIRLPDSIAVYTFDFPRNEFGYELLVEKDTGFVIDAGETVDIRKGAYIISAHGSAMEILKNIRIGDIIEMDFPALTVKRDPVYSEIKLAEINNDKVDEIIESKARELYDIDFEEIERINIEINEEMDALRIYSSSEDADLEKIEKRLSDIWSLIDLKYALTLECYAVEGRGIWHRPNASAIDETTLDGVKEFAAYLHDMGINALYVETYWHGMTTYYSEALDCQHPRMMGFDYGEYGDDYTLALISECHKLGIEVHAWVELLSAGSYYGIEAPYIKQEWLYSDHTGDTSGGYIDPTNPEVQQYLATVIGEMVEKYDFDGISYDYIRYSDASYSGDFEDCGFTEHSVSEFSKKYGYKGNDLAYDIQKNAELRGKWHAFKRDAVTSTVKGLTELIRSLDPEMIISSSPYGFINDAYNIYMQDIELWLDNGYLDVVLPMIYTENTDSLTSAAVVFNNYPTVLQYTGISPLYNGDTIRKNQELVVAVKSLNISGVSFFATQNYIVEYPEYAEYILKALTCGSNREQALTPTSDINMVWDAWRGQLAYRYERIYRENLSERDSLTALDFLENAKSCITVEQMLACLEDFNLAIGDFEDCAAHDRIKEQADYIYRILMAAKEREDRK